ncbi:chemotaxis protein CheA [Telmatobacter sp. DSM 110680]|uniref:Chemotaxis protein CheA n=1 Tax=Telmatobacter sp. DSM 110680 TaxID=3036704 RepID=A0AAU7DLH3_9BACT
MSSPAANNQFRQAFREEAHEILIDLETALLELNEKREDTELVSRAFRALHTIKGSGAMFGFDALAAFTHSLENAFDEVRSGRLAVTADLVDLTLSALDHMRDLLQDIPLNNSIDRDSLLTRLRSMIATRQQGPGERNASGGLAVDHLPDPASSRVWTIHFAPGPQLMRAGSDPLLLIRELGSLGELLSTANMASIPPLAELDPERCYITWDFVLRTSVGLDAIRDVFIFVEDCCELSIEPQEPPTENEGYLIAGRLEDKRESRGGRRHYDSPDSSSSIRVAAAKLDEFVNLVGELVTVQARLSELAVRRDDPDVSAVAEEVDRLASALRETSMNVRMMPIRGTFERFRRLVHDLARDLDKDVELSIEGADTELDKSVIHQLGDPLMHLIRNSMDHGIGTPEDRVAHGKPARATIHLAARYSGASVLISVCDDGRGIDVDAVRARAIERGLIKPDAQPSDSEIHALLFQPGFSTAQEVTDISGRGVGMDVVRRNVDKLRGSIDVASKSGQGTTVTLRLPLTLAIIDGLLVTVGDAYFVLPLADTLECVELSRSEIDNSNGKQLVNVRGQFVPYIRLRDHFNITNALPDFEQVMLVDTEDGYCGLVFDRVLGNCQTMIKSLGRLYQHVQAVSGATILGNGKVALILDPHRLVQECVRAVGLRVRGHPRLSGSVGGALSGPWNQSPPI